MSSLEGDESPEPEPRQGADLLHAAEAMNDDKAAAKGKKITAQESADALEWFLSDSDAVDLSTPIQINVGSRDEPRWVEWIIRPVDMDKLRRIRRKAQNAGRRQRQPDMDETTANIQIVLEGTVKPDLRAAARQLGIVDPADAVRTRFAHKPGLVTQIAGEIMSVSGYDDEDVREVDAAQG